MRNSKLLFILFILHLAWPSFGPKALAQNDSHNALYGKIVKEIRVKGARFTDTDIITREMASKVGQPYLKENAERDYARIDRLDIFSQLSIQPIQEQGGVVLEIEVKEIFPYLPFFSYQVTDENGFAGGPGFQSVNLARRDIFFTGAARFGGATNIVLFVENPWFAGNHLGYTLEVLQRERFNELDQFNEISTELSLRISSFIGEYGRIGGRFGFLSVKSDSSGRTLSADNRDNLPTFGFFIGYDSRDLWSNPHTGWWNEIDIAKSGGFLGADNDYWTLNLDIRRYIPIIEKHTLALFSLTTLSTGDVGDEISPVEDFHIGGTNSVRGWDVGARGGGKNQFINTAEYRVTLMRPKLLSLFGLTADVGLQVAAFGDLGVVWNDSDQFDTDNFIGGYGVGLRFLVPFVNMFRFDIGFGEPGESFRVHIGAFEKPVAQRFRVR
ncbi:BamA/TamA family outer membrane protein [candidate division KSB1 bacterium]|nr:BamA/TamA family outer membrane protein [candidate division KSB1 bacterium]NIR70948.1 BamA/TamA family outer membrane protein [candidate division KSB1 bacterium]NIS23251.1 BamA/TamA family outer membrane protein [candidate division KSB1 bacterium]NIT70133.1 BamA/TamA family outer membrane protein [candidate division KSB1 bacterium]NIU23787.1 BamA/TamA family outer membrane protein [candidate division KSB1 bacterium]